MHSNQNESNQYGSYNTPAYKISKAINQVGVKGASEIQGDFEYMYEENRVGHLSTNTPYISEDYYVLPPQDRKTAAYNEQPVIRAQNRVFKKCSITIRMDQIPRGVVVCMAQLCL